MHAVNLLPPQFLMSAHVRGQDEPHELMRRRIFHAIGFDSCDGLGRESFCNDGAVC